MAEFVKKAMMGYYKDAPGGESDPECTHVILKKGVWPASHRKGSGGAGESKHQV